MSCRAVVGVGTQTKTNKYFLDSGDKIRFFFEENAFTAEGELKQEKKLSINKIAHGTVHNTHAHTARHSRAPHTRTRLCLDPFGL